MTLSTEDFIFLDFQTTGTSAQSSDVIEAGFGLYRAADDPLRQTWQLHLVALESGGELSRTIQRLTGLPADYHQREPSLSSLELRGRLRAFLESHPHTPIVLHFAQFKLPFLWKVLGLEEDDAFRQSLAARVICVHKIARLLMPQLKSFSLRAVAGYAGYATAEKKRSKDHLIATAFIWRFVSHTLEQRNPPAAGLVEWLKALKPGDAPAKTLPIHDELLRKKRLSLPHEPGVYFFLDAFGHVLYVGKALDLHHRVNSYFRGRKTKGTRLNEMLTRAVDFRYELVGSELEALLKENDEIKRIDPPYNRALREEGRVLSSVRFNDLLERPVAWGSRRFGPLSSLWMVDFILRVLQSSEYDIPRYMRGVHGDLIAEALELLFAEVEGEALDPHDIAHWSRLAASVWDQDRARLIERALQPKAKKGEVEEEELEPEVAAEEEAEEEASDWTKEDVAFFLRDAMKHLMRQIYRSRWLLRLSHADIRWHGHGKPAGEEVFYRVNRGVFAVAKTDERLEPLSALERQAAFDPLVYDRMAILLAELKKGLRRGDSISISFNGRERLTLTTDELRRTLIC